MLGDGERAADGHHGLLIIADGLLERIAPDVVDLGPVIRWGPESAEAPVEPTIVK